MRVDLNHGTQQVPEGNSGSMQNPAANRSASLSPAIGEDQAQLSGAQVQVEALAGQASQLPEVREERVQALRQAVETGRYQPAPLEVAGAMLTYMVAGSAA
jgi:flagellar biosynthesis anti-sigma factor FlgM